MIYDSIDHIETYRGIHPLVMKGLEILRDTDFSQMPDGRYDVEGDDLYYSLMHYDSKENQNKLEAHKLYVDIQFVLEGREYIGVAPLKEVTELDEPTEGDIRFYTGYMDDVLLAPGRFAAVWPGDAHAPGRAVNGVEHCRKCVVKVKVN